MNHRMVFLWAKFPMVGIFELLAPKVVHHRNWPVGAGFVPKGTTKTTHGGNGNAASTGIFSIIFFVAAQQKPWNNPR